MKLGIDDVMKKRKVENVRERKDGMKTHEERDRKENEGTYSSLKFCSISTKENTNVTLFILLKIASLVIPSFFLAKSLNSLNDWPAVSSFLNG